MIEGLRRALALCRWNVSGVGKRLRGTIVITTGFFAVVMVFVAVLAVRDGITRSAMRPGGDGIGVVAGNRGSLDAAAVNLIAQAPGVAKDAHGPIITGITTGAMILQDWQPDRLGLALVMSINGARAGILPGFHIVEGRMFRPGHNEMVIGEGAKRLFQPYSTGSTVEWMHCPWKIVGVYSTGSSVQDSQFLADLHQTQATAMSHDSVYVKLSRPAAFDSFKIFLTHKSGLDITVDRLSDADRRYGEDLKGILELIDGVITALMAAGAVFASLNVTYASVARRSSELALLRALGFSRLSVLSTVLSEVMLLALIGGAAGVLAAILVFNGLETGSLIGGHPVVFRFAVTPSAMAIGLLLTLGMGFVGGLFPAVGAARRSVAAGLRGE